MTEKKNTKKQEIERKEALMRIIVGVVSGIILYFWGYVILVFIIANIFYTLIKRNKSADISGLCEIFNSQVYSFLRYMTFVSNERPFPFGKLEKNISKIE